MDDSTPLNELEQAMAAIAGSAERGIAFLRMLIAGEDGFLLWLLQISHPEVDGVDGFLIGPSEVLPFLTVKNHEGKNAVLLFTSDARAKEYLAKVNVPTPRCHPVKMGARHAGNLIGKSRLHAILNKSCSTGPVLITPQTLRQMATGTFPAAGFRVTCGQEKDDSNGAS